MGHNATLDRTSRSVVSRMEHVHLAVADLERSVTWYERVLGLRVRWSDGTTAHVGTDRFYVAVTEYPGLPPAPDSSSTARIAHFAFTTPDLEAFKARLSEVGAHPYADAHRTEGDAVYLRDPDGNAIEIVGYRDDYVYA